MGYLCTNPIIHNNKGLSLNSLVVHIFHFFEYQGSFSKDIYVPGKIARYVYIVQKSARP